MAVDAAKRFFFIHVMKTGGTSFADLLRLNFIDNQRYPDVVLAPEVEVIRRMEAYMYVPKFVADVNRLCEQLRIVRAHVPYAVRSLLQESYETLTILRNPVDRTLSYLKHCRHYHKEHANMTLEDIYEEPWFHRCFINNYQTRIFSMTSQESLQRNHFANGSPILPTPEALKSKPSLSPELVALRERCPARFTLQLFATGTGNIEVDDKRLGTAMDNLSSVDVVGVTEHYDRFLMQLRDRYGWKLQSIPRRNIGASDTVSLEFRKRIAVDNAADIALYEHAKTIESTQRTFIR